MSNFPCHPQAFVCAFVGILAFALALAFDDCRLTASELVLPVGQETPCFLAHFHSPPNKERPALLISVWFSVSFRFFRACTQETLITRI